MTSLVEENKEVTQRFENKSNGGALPLEIPIIQGRQLLSGTPLVAGFIPVGILIPDMYDIPWYDTRTKKGYQRQPQQTRINQLATDLRKNRTDLPTAVLLNLRGREAREVTTDGKIVVSRLTQPFRVVDGQHRILALKKLVEENAEAWSNFSLPFVCLIGADEKEEMEQFYIVNSTAKSVKTDLALALLKTRAEKDVQVYEALQERAKEWQVQAQGLVETLASTSQIWKHRIRLASMEKGETTIPSASMVMSLKPLFNTPYFAGLRTEHQLRVLEAYWQGIRELLRPAFDDPSSYSLQKGVGVIIMHAVLPNVLECVRNRGLVTTDPTSYSQILEEALMKLEGENATGEPVTGLMFWQAAPVGAAGAYSSSAGRRVLLAKIRQLLPEMDLE